MKIHAGKYAVHPYNSDLVVCTSRAAARKALKHKPFKCAAEDIEEAITGAGLAYRAAGHYLLAVFDKQFCTLVHEAVHVASQVLNRAGIDPMSNDQEALAYLVDDLVRRITKEK